MGKNIITLKGIIDEDFINYKYPSMTLMLPKCTFKCEYECGQRICQNSSLANLPDIEVDIGRLCERYIKNKISHAVVLQGLEPFDSFNEVNAFISCLRHKYNCNDDIVIYTGYNEDEIKDRVAILKSNYAHIIIKYGRYMPGNNKHFDSVLGVYLVSDNQYAIEL